MGNLDKLLFAETFLQNTPVKRFCDFKVLGHRFD
jgi:hypothetical protein